MWTCSRVHEKVWAFGAQEFLLHRWLTVYNICVYVCVQSALLFFKWLLCAFFSYSSSSFTSFEIRSKTVTIAIAITNAINIHSTFKYTEYAATFPSIFVFMALILTFSSYFHCLSIAKTLSSYNPKYIYVCLYLSLCLTETVGNVYIDLFMVWNFH